jgi:hypothetical protein
MPLTHRLLAAALAMVALSVLMMASQIVPAPGGLGTHTQLGMQPCGFIVRTGIPCAACGMTTSFAHLMRGEIVQSLYTQPFGCLLGIGTAAAVSLGLYCAITGRAAYMLLTALPMRWHLMIWLSLAGLAWVWKIFVVVTHPL